MKINNQRNRATWISILSRFDECLSFFHPLSSYSRICLSKTRQTQKVIKARANRTVPSTVRPAPRTYRKHQRTPRKAATKAENKRTWSPLMNIQYRTSPSSRLISSLRSPSRSSFSSFNCSLQAASLRVVNFEVAEEGGLRFDLRAVADDDDLHVGGVQILARRGEQI